MKKGYRTILLTPFLLVCASGLTSCNKTSDLTLRILNSEDYIYLSESDDPEDKDLIDRFVDYVEANYPEYKGVKVVYDTSDTNETIYSEIQTGKSNYDLINVSEYMAQKIVSGGYATKIDQDKIPNYQDFASKEIKSRLDNITTTIKEYDETQNKRVDVEVKLEDYAVGYMWGTLGILFNPNYSDIANRDIAQEDVLTDMRDFGALWDAKYKNTISIKNSMRDTYALGVMETYRAEFEELLANLDSEDEESLNHYKEEFAKIFNRCDEKSVGEVQAKLEELKKNVFGLEVDSGKQDIITQKIGVNLAWSGDAVYSMDQADEIDLELYYSVPELGSNIWSDVWVMPNNQRSEAQNELAHIFLNYLCDPDIASLNMNYTGYTSFIGGDSILELVRDWYDIRTDEIYFVTDEEEYLQIYSITDTEYTAIDYSDFLKDRDNSRDEELLVYFIPYEDEEGNLIEEPLDYDDLIAHSDKVYLLDENDEETETQKTYADLTVVDADDSELEAVDLSYFFNGTLFTTAEDKYGDDLADMDPSEVVLYEENVDTIFYSDCYLPFTYEDEEGNEVQNKAVGRQFFCQYPDKDTINRCAVMEDYGENNVHVMKMWENFKSDPLPVWAVITLIVFIVGILALIAYFVVNKILTNNVRKKRVEK